MTNFHDGYLDRGQPLGMIPQIVTLTADNQVVALNQKTSLLQIYSDDTTATNRTFTLTPGYLTGQELALVVMSGGATTCELQDSGNCALSAAWTPQINDTLRLMWTGSVWAEVARSDN